MIMKATSFKFDDKTMHILDSLKERVNASSRKEVIRKALYLLDIVTRAQMDRKRIIVKGIDSDSEIEIQIY